MYIYPSLEELYKNCSAEEGTVIAMAVYDSTGKLLGFIKS